MKKGYIKILILELSLLIILLVNSFILNILNYYTLSLLLLLTLIVSYFLIGFEKQKNRYKKDTIINLLIYVIVHLLIIYLSGIFIGFVRNGYSLKLLKVITNVIPVMITIIISEILRYQFVIKGEGSKLVNFILIFLFVNVDITLFMYQYNFSSIESLIRFVSMVLLPSISKNIAITYITRKTGYTPSIVYRLVMELYIYIVPIIPNLGEYITAILETIFPTLIFARIYQLFKKEDINKKEDIRYNKTPTIFFYTITILFLVTVVVLSSGKFRYQSFTIGSESMTPSIKVGDVVIAEKIENKKNINIDDILVYNHNNKIIVHRVVERKELEDNVYYYTKGDANKDNDNYPIDINSIIGIVKFKLPYIGYPTILLNRKLNK